MEPQTGLLGCNVGDNHDVTRALLVEAMLLGEKDARIHEGRVSEMFLWRPAVPFVPCYTPPRADDPERASR